MLLPLITIKKEGNPRYSVSFDSIKFLKGLKEKKLSILFLFDFEGLSKKTLAPKLLKLKEPPVQSATQNIGIIFFLFS